MKLNLQLIILLTVLPAALVTMTGCTRQKEVLPPDLAVIPVQLGKPTFPFDPAQTVSLNIAKADPISGETWSARVEKSNGVWQISSYSGNSQLSDRLANRAWILHFLDTLTTFRADSYLAEWDSGHYGFSPPRYSVEWRIERPYNHQTTTYELRVGAPVDFEKNPDGESFAIFPPHTEIYQAGGAALVMLRYLKTFSSLRLETLSTLEAQDVTAVDVQVGGKKKIHSLYNGKKWVGRDLSDFVGFVTHLRVQNFIDQLPSSGAPAFAPFVTVALTDRYHQITTLTFDKNDIARSSERGSASFEMYPGSVAKLAGF